MLGKQRRCFKRSPEPNPPPVGLINIPFVFLLRQKAAALEENKSQSHHGAASASLVPPYPFQGTSVAMRSKT